MSYITIGEAAKILGKDKKTLMRWDETEKLIAQREPVSKIRVYDKVQIEKIARWFDLRKREKEHLRKLPAVIKKRDKFLPIAPLDPFSNPKRHNAEEMKEAYKEYNEWNKKYDDLQEEYIEFTEGIYGELEK